MRAKSALHGMMMVQRSGLRALSSPQRRTVYPTSLSSMHHRVGRVVVCRMIEEATDVVYEKRVQLVSDFLLVGEIQSSLEWNPSLVS